LQYLLLALSHIHSRTQFKARANVSKFGESPGVYFTRTIHADNVGVVGIDAVASYHGCRIRSVKLRKGRWQKARREVRLSLN